MELTHSFVDLLQHFAPVFTRPTHLTFVAVVTGWSSRIVAAISPT